MQVRTIDGIKKAPMTPQQKMDAKVKAMAEKLARYQAMIFKVKLEALRMEHKAGRQEWSRCMVRLYGEHMASASASEWAGDVMA